MTDKKLQALIEKSIRHLETLRKIQKVHYSMDFGDLVIQYDFCLN